MEFNFDCSQKIGSRCGIERMAMYHGRTQPNIKEQYKKQKTKKKQKKPSKN